MTPICRIVFRHFYEGTQVDEHVDYDKSSLRSGDKLSSITVDGQGKDAGTYDLDLSRVNILDEKGKPVNDNYEITLEKGKLIIGKVPITIRADDKSSKKGEALRTLTYRMSGDPVKGDELGIRLSTTADKNKAGTYVIKVAWNNNKSYKATLADGKYTVTAEPAPKVSSTLMTRMTAKGKTGLVVGWNRIQGAEGYDIFFARCNHGGKKIACKHVKTIKGNKTFKWRKSGLKKGKSYKLYVRAYVTKNGRKVYISKSPMMHAYTGNGNRNCTNARSVTVNRTKVTLKKGKTFRIRARVNKVNKNKKLMPESHVTTLRYKTSDSRIAAVNSGGRITAKGRGTCYIYAFAHNGVSKRIKVTVP